MILVPPTFDHSARPSRISPQRQQIRDFLKRESQILGSANESNSLNDV